MNLLLQTVVNGFSVGSVYAMIALGLSLIFGVLGVINFAHGEFVMVGMYATYVASMVIGWEPYLLAPIVVCVSLVLGLLSYWLVFAWVPHGSQEKGLLLTLGYALVLANVARVVFSANYYTVRSRYVSNVVRIGGIVVSEARLLTLAVVIVSILGVFCVLRYTHFGRCVRAVSQNPVGADLVGINRRSISCVTVMIGAVLCGLAGLLILPTLHVYPSIGTYFTIKAFVIVVLGGKGNLPGVLLAGLLLGIGETAAATYWRPDLKDAVGLGIFLLFLLSKQNGALSVQHQE